MIMIGGKLISQGSYGCVFVPPLKCEKNEMPPEGIISKVQANDEYAVMEYKIGSQLSGYKSYFAPVQKQCSANFTFTMLNNINKGQNLGSCRPAMDKKKEYVVLKSDYIKGGELRPHILTPKHDRTSELLNQFVHILKGIKILNEKNIIHHDLKSGNILVDSVSKTAKIIDFGMSFTRLQYMDNKKKTIKRSFVKYAPEYVQYPPEVHMISALFFLKNVNKQNAIMRVAVDNTNELNKLFPDLFKDNDEYTRYRNSIQNEVYNTIKGEKDAVVIYNKLFSTWKTWDVYALFIDMYITVSQIIKSTNGKDKKAILIRDEIKAYIKSPINTRSPVDDLIRKINNFM